VSQQGQSYFSEEGVLWWLQKSASDGANVTFHFLHWCRLLCSFFLHHRVYNHLCGSVSKITLGCRRRHVPSHPTGWAMSVISCGGRHSPPPPRRRYRIAAEIILGKRRRRRERSNAESNLSITPLGDWADADTTELNGSPYQMICTDGHPASLARYVRYGAKHVSRNITQRWSEGPAFHFEYWGELSGQGSGRGLCLFPSQKRGMGMGLGTSHVAVGSRAEPRPQAINWLIDWLIE